MHAATCMGTLCAMQNIIVNTLSCMHLMLVKLILLGV
jgi:hypothetical protein